jgi:hypothetical protein
LTWDHVDLTGKPEALPPVPPNIRVWRSVRLSNETKTEKSRRSLALAQRAVDALTTHRARQNVLRGEAGDAWQRQLPAGDQGSWPHSEGLDPP